MPFGSPGKSEKEPVTISLFIYPEINIFSVIHQCGYSFNLWFSSNHLPRIFTSKSISVSVLKMVDPCLDIIFTLATLNIVHNTLKYLENLHLVNNKKLKWKNNLVPTVLEPNIL